MSADILIGCVDANAKVGNYPFTTIEPNHGVGFYVIPCPFEKSAECKPLYGSARIAIVPLIALGKCVKGMRYIPVRMLDVAGLVPGASEGRGLGNKFLDDLRTADILLHIVDVSGTTNEKGEATRGYDPLQDVDWLQSEIHAWIHNNMWRKWSSITRRHNATQATAVSTLQAQVSGYGTKEVIVQRTLDRLELKEPIPLESWDEAAVKRFVDAFLIERFPTVLVLNKVDSPDADKNIARICQKYPNHPMVLVSALAECFLRKLSKQGFVGYTDGAEFIETSEEDHKLKPMDEKTKERVDKLKDLVMLRFGGTGVHDVIRKAVERLGLIPVYIVSNISNFTCGGEGVFRNCTLVRPGTSVREVAKTISGELERTLAYAEIVGGQRARLARLLQFANENLADKCR